MNGLGLYMTYQTLHNMPHLHAILQLLQNLITSKPQSVRMKQPTTKWFKVVGINQTARIAPGLSLKFEGENPLELALAYSWLRHLYFSKFNMRCLHAWSYSDRCGTITLLCLPGPATITWQAHPHGLVLIIKIQSLQACCWCLQVLFYARMIQWTEGQ